MKSPEKMGVSPEKYAPIQGGVKGGQPSIPLPPSSRFREDTRGAPEGAGEKFSPFFGGTPPKKGTKNSSPALDAKGAQSRCGGSGGG